MTANAYRTRARIRLASKMLLTTMAPIARIALNAGFSDQSHLTRAFSRSLGLSPAGFRRTFAR
jgi:transcriptional regulator GlxA family with amidase domain